MGKFQFIETVSKGVYVIEPTVFGDNRGYFMETYNYNEFKEAGLDMVLSLIHICPIMPFQVFISTTTVWLKLPKTSNRPLAVKLKSPASTMLTWNWAN